MDAETTRNPQPPVEAQPPPNAVLMIEAVADVLNCDDGNRIMEFHVQNGRLTKTYLHHGPISNSELGIVSMRQGG